jgi:iron complex outermembrane receptor protein
MHKFLTAVSLLPLIAIGTAGHAQTAPAPVATPADAPSPSADIIVTGTRVTGVKAADSAAPIQLLGAPALTRVGQPDLIDALEQSLPSFNSEQYGQDAGALVLAANLRGLNPNDTLVLIDGKRRHGTSNLHIDPGPFQGAASADLGLIPVASIDHIEVLTDGAAAQYGSDAVAGVINIITKKNTDAGSISASIGQYYEGDGKTYDISANKGFKLGDKGYVNITIDDHYHGHSLQGTYDSRFFSQSGQLTSTGVNGAGIPGAPGYPYVNKIYGDTLSHVFNTLVNAGYDLTPDVQVYAQGSYAHRTAQAYENYRAPNKVVATTAIAALAGTADMLPGVTPVVSDGEVYPFPNGFQPLEAVDETDFAFTGGIKGTVSSWDFDLSSTFGKDNNAISTIHSANVGLYAATGFTPTNFYDGRWITTQWTSNLDINREFAVGLATPLDVAFGGEIRRDTYQIMPGDPASYYSAGAASYPGFQPTDAGKYTRRNYAGYVDVSADPLPNWKVDLAGRYEHFSDAGNSTVGKLTTRYDITPEIAVRGTLSTGFRAPTLAEEHYSATNVAPSFAVVNLPPNTSAATALGFTALKPEKSHNYSAGLVLHPVPRMQITVDAYQISIRNRIINTGTIVRDDQNAAAVNAAIAARNVTIDPSVTYVGIATFTNGANTRTRGIDLTANYASDFEGVAHVDWSLGMSYNESKITSEQDLPAVLGGGPIINQISADYLTTANPRVKIIAGAYVTHGPFSLNLRETLYGTTSVHFSPDATGQGANVTLIKTPATPITDIDLGYKVTSSIKFDFGANNLFNKKPPIIPYIPGVGLADGNNVYREPYQQSPYGINGGYYYAKFVWNF